MNKRAEKLTTYDPAAALVNDREIAFFLSEALETGNAAYIAHALGVATHAPREWPMWLGKPGFPTASRLSLMSDPVGSCAKRRVSLLGSNLLILRKKVVRPHHMEVNVIQ